jgi:thiamine-phosphate pyrophosphorylase
VVALPERLLVITDRRLAPTGLGGVLDAALAATGPGRVLVQVREKDLAGKALLALLAEVLAVARPRGARVVVNDRADVALLSGADGVHLPEAGLPIADARRLLGPGALIGVSVHDAPGVARAAGADYLVAGPVWDTPGKRAMGLAAVAALAARAPAPVFAVGGLDAQNAAGALAAGAHGVAVIRAVMAARDPGAAARALVGALPA